MNWRDRVTWEGRIFGAVEAGRTTRALERVRTTRTAYDAGQPIPDWNDLTTEEVLAVWDRVMVTKDVEYIKWVHRHHCAKVLTATKEIPE